MHLTNEGKQPLRIPFGLQSCDKVVIRLVQGCFKVGSKLFQEWIDKIQGGQVVYSVFLS